MPFPLIPVLAGLAGTALGIGKSAAEDANNERNRKVKAATQRYSPWTGLVDNTPDKPANWLGNIAGGAVAGGLQGAQLENLDMSDWFASAPEKTAMMAPNLTGTGPVNYWDRLSDLGLGMQPVHKGYGMRGLSLLGGK